MTVGRDTRVPVGVPGERAYEVVVAAGAVTAVGAHATEAAPAVRRWAVISDDTVGALYGDIVVGSLAAAGRPAELHTFPAGEARKTRETWAALTDALIAAGHARDSGVVALGGGVVGDLAGFVAATFMRGVPVVQVPTSVVAMVDSAVGGKTGVDSPAGKNLVGAFHAPVRVVVDPVVVSTLPRARRAEGLAEAVKHGALVDDAYARGLAEAAGDLLGGDPGAVEAMVVRSVRVKADVVARDEREAGLREILNFGHTLGHALEAASDYALSHGEAVAAGMILEARLGEALGVTRAGTAMELAAILDALTLPAAPPPGLDPERVLAFTRTDKKVREGRARYVLLESLGTVATAGGQWARPVDEAAVRAVLGAA